jgi:hypothetical protein
LNDRGITDFQIFEKSVKVKKSRKLIQKIARPPKPCPLIRLASSDLVFYCCVRTETPSNLVRVVLVRQDRAKV